VTAERLFGEFGFEATSLRQITSVAGTNLAAVNYHFQSKHQLVIAVIRRRMEPITKQRFAMLAQLEAEHPNGPLPAEGVLNALLKPLLEIRASDEEDFQHLQRLIARIFMQPEDWLKEHFQPAIEETARRFFGAFQRAFPHHSAEDIQWGIHMMIGAAIHSLGAKSLMKSFPFNEVDMDDVEQNSSRMVRFFAAGMRAMAKEERTS